VRKGIVISLALSALAGVIYFVLLGYAWAYIPQYNPITNWLFDNLVHTVWFRPLIYLHDLLLNIVLGLPLALLIYILWPKHFFLHLAVTLLPSFAWTHSSWLTDADLNIDWPDMVPGMVNELFCVPIALAIIFWFRRTRT
jgi:hypothetical protein